MVSSSGSDVTGRKTSEFLDLPRHHHPAPSYRYPRQRYFCEGFRGKDLDKDEGFRNLSPYRKTVSMRTRYRDAAGYKKLPKSNWLAMIFRGDCRGRSPGARTPTTSRNLRRQNRVYAASVFTMFMLLTGHLIIILTKTKSRCLSRVFALV